MKAAVCRAYGPAENVKIEEVEKPMPGADEVLVKVVASTVDIADVRIRALRVPKGLSFPTRLAMGLFKPKYPIFGLQFSGIVEAVGANVSAYKVGQEVVGSSGFRFGAHAEFIKVGGDSALVQKPDNLTHEEAVSVLFGGSTAMGYFNAAGLKAGDNILINGASGAVGVAAVQIAKHMGATVTGVCSGKNVELVKSLGADHVIDYTKEDFKASTDKFDFVMDNVGNAPFAKVKHMLKPDGKTLVVIFANALEMIKVLTNKRAVMLTSDSEKEVMGNKMYAHLMDLAAQGVLKPVIDTSFPFEKIADAHRLVDGGHKVGAVVVRVAA
ncbi:NAD(P)-dependent alcohol dehydrogenase [Maritalea mediterranea]|uniref:NAD(P)-dependent alcohol dehydrogenase n=1 Tax=Maritalea mediterranea TaxID=2909667 RepID=A0ABS9E7X6_9HYPH|nr:NAD(P)-dependent alcohol dehydrogenase [Maritalea mediterranea]MCF4098908.1 NAD(P)-dependent alcohol dehydrogenase [Maritalea mediterranea]